MHTLMHIRGGARVVGRVLEQSVMQYISQEVLLCYIVLLEFQPPTQALGVVLVDGASLQ